MRHSSSSAPTPPWPGRSPSASAGRIAGGRTFPRSAVTRRTGRSCSAPWAPCTPRASPSTGAALDPSGQFLRLPSYPWQRERHWLEAAAPSRAPQGNGTYLNGSGNGGDSDNGAAPAYRNGNAPLSRNGATGTHAASGVHAGDLGDCLYELQWQPKDRPEPGTRTGGREGTWLILEDSRGVGRAVRSLLEARGASCVMVTHADTSSFSGAGGYRLDPADPVGFRRLVEDVAHREGRPLRGVVHIWSLDAAAPTEASVAAIDAAQRLGCGSVLHLVQALAAAAVDPPPRLWLVTRGAQPASPAPTAPDVAQAPVWGMGRSIALEHPQLWGGLVDLDPDAPQGEALALAGELLDPDGEDQSAFRGGRRHVARLVRGDRPGHQAQALPVRPEGTYLITGGLGDLGLRVARWLVEHGARRLVLASRRGLSGARPGTASPRTTPRKPVEAIRELERLGATVLVAAADVGDPSRMAALFDQVRGLLPPLRGVIHAAGIVTPLPLRDTSLDVLDAVLRPKVAGTWVLHRLTRELPLDFFVAFSSISSVLGSPELASYAAANQFLDAFAHAARASGRPMLSINWGPWQGEGMAATAERSRAIKLLGLRPLGPERGLRALAALAADGLAQATVADVDWFTFKTIYEQRGRRFLEQVEAPEPARPEAADGLEDGPTWWRDLPPDRRRERLIAYFRGRIAEVLRMEPTRIDPERSLSTLGLDSLMALELKGGVEEDLKAVLPLTTLLQGPSTVELADQVLMQWQDLAFTPASAPAPAAAVGPITEHPASIGQRSLWLLHQLAPGSAAYSIGGAVRVRAELDVDVLRRSFQRLVDRHAALRTTFATVDGQPVQRVHDSMEAWFRAKDASSWSEEEVGRRLSDEAHRPFDLEAGPLFRAHLFTRSAREHYVLMTIHHAISDLWSIAVLMQELAQVYPAERAGTVAALSALPLQYADYARWQAEMLSGPEGERLWAYWRERLAGPLPVLDLPTDRPRPAVQTDRGGARSLRLDPELTRALAALGRLRGASLHVILLAAFQALLARLSNQDDIIVGTPVVGRNRPGLADVVGYFVNPLPIRADFAGRPTFEALLDQVRRAMHDGLEHQEFPFALMVDRLQPTRDPGRSPLFQVMFVYQKARRLDEEGVAGFSLREGGSRMKLGEFPLEAMSLERRAAQFDLTMYAAVDEGRLVVSLEYNADLFDAATIDRMLGHFETLLEGVIVSPGRPVAALPLLTEAERRLVLVDWTATAADSPHEACVHRLFEAQAERTPDEVALTFEGRQLTYGALNAQRQPAGASPAGARRRARGPGRPLHGARASMVVGLLGILKAGGAYVPLDPDYPRDRLGWMLSDSGAAVLLTERALLERLPPHAAAVLCLDRDGSAFADEPDGVLAGGATLDNLAYVIYTSGSTGTPKGAMIDHRGLANYLTWAVRTYDVAVGQGAPVHSSISFDLTVTALWAPLLVGRRIDLLGEDLGIEALGEALRRGSDYSLVKITPAHLQLLAQQVAPAEAAGRTRAFIIGGEQLTGEHVAFWQEHAPDTLLVNEYGPTETVVGCCVYRAEPGERFPGAVPIGRPIANTRLYVLDRHLEPVPVGEAGELYIGGVGVARGYLKRPGLTAEKFLPDPFGTEPGARLYRTGDLCRWRADGNLEFLGRVDHQVKIRGYRIELGEVEAALLRHPAVRAAVVAARRDTARDQRLVAYLVAKPEPPAPAELRQFLKGTLPEYMVPSAFVALEALPLTSNGKVDRNALPAPPPAQAEREAPPIAARNAVEEVLARVTAEVLGCGAIGVHDNFFELGLDSILSIQIVSRVRQAGLHLSPAQVFQHQTIAELATVTAPAAPDPAEPGEVAGPVPLTPIQRWFFEQELPEPHHYNQALLLEVSPVPDAALVAEALEHLIRHHDALGLRFARDASGWRQWVAFDDGVAVPFSRVDLAALPRAARRRRWRRRRPGCRPASTSGAGRCCRWPCSTSARASRAGSCWSSTTWRSTASPGGSCSRTWRRSTGSSPGASRRRCRPRRPRSAAGPRP